MSFDETEKKNKKTFDMPYKRFYKNKKELNIKKNTDQKSC